jgi:hypothetical protein
MKTKTISEAKHAPPAIDVLQAKAESGSKERPRPVAGYLASWIFLLIGEGKK